MSGKDGRDLPPLVELLYQHLLENWHVVEGKLDRDEHREYQKCFRFRDEAWIQLEKTLESESRDLLNIWLTNTDQAHEIECRLCFARGLSMGISLGLLAEGR